MLDDDGSSFADFSDELNSFTTSCGASVTRFPVENGRRYHAFKPGTYPLPNDDAELDRLNLVHHMIKKALGDRLLLAPFANVSRVLDIGTGTGIWAMEMGEAYPEVEFLGNDLSPVQPSWVPPNVRWEVDDIESRWAYGVPFDFIFCRTLPCAVGDWPRLVGQVFDNVRPGGWVEFQDHNLVFYAEDDSYSQNSDAAQWVRLLMRASRLAGKEPCPGPKLRGWMSDAGFVNVTERKVRLPIGPWPRDARQVSGSPCGGQKRMDTKVVTALPTL